jgi:hypothetical protein|tara:strand:+ start:2056 stop:2229 length:174 start_codon:yes stop_codon:yes gene_type:complete
MNDNVIKEYIESIKCLVVTADNYEEIRNKILNEIEKEVIKMKNKKLRQHYQVSEEGF